MKQKKFLPIIRCLQALFLSAAIFWLVSVTAGSVDLPSAWAALRADAPELALRWELGDLWRLEGLSPATMLTLSQSPLLLSARTEVTGLWGQEETEPIPTPQQRPIPQKEEFNDSSTPIGVDNGVTAKTLTPNDPSGYTVCGPVYISNSTDHTLSVESLRQTFSAELSTEDGPQILILHTHGSEAYTPVDDNGIVWSGDHRTTDSRYNVVRMGDTMAQVFGQAGISVLHDRTLYDYPNYTGAYDRSLAAINDYLKQYPSIRFILDVHRDAIEDGAGNQYKAVSDVGELGTASQLSLIIGSDGGGLYHPQWMENLRLAVAIQENILSDYPTLMRPVLLRNSRYNQHATTGSVLVEVGTAGNAPEEAELAAKLFAQKMIETLQERSK